MYFKLLYFIKKYRLNKIFYSIALLSLIFPYQNCADTRGAFIESLKQTSKDFISDPDLSPPLEPTLPPTDNLPPDVPNTNMDIACSQGRTLTATPSTITQLGIQPGDQVYLEDGNYAKIPELPSGVSRNKMTCLRAKNPGKIKMSASLKIGEQARHDKYIYIEGITFLSSSGGHNLYNSSYIYIKNCGFNTNSNSAAGIINVGSNDINTDTNNPTLDSSGRIVNSNILLEDIWAWGNARVGLLVYRSEKVVVRRAVIRNDGCTSRSVPCGVNSGNYMVGTSIYNSHHISFQNIITADNLLGQGYPGAADIQTAWHNNYPYPFGANEWFGNLSVNSEYYGLSPEIDDTSATMGNNFGKPLFSYKDIVVLYPKNGVAAVANSKSNMDNGLIHLENLTLMSNESSNSGIFSMYNWDGANQSSFLRNSLIYGSGAYGVKSTIALSYLNVFGNWTSGAYRSGSKSCGLSANCYSIDPINSASLKYPVRIEPGPLKTKGFSSQPGVQEDIGANIIYQYGVDGTFFGEANYNSLTSNNLWPYPNQKRIQKEMCTDLGLTRGFCSKQNLSYYIWEYLGNACPAGVCE